MVVHMPTFLAAAQNVVQNVRRTKERQGAHYLGRNGQPEELPVGEGGAHTRITCVCAVSILGRVMPSFDSIVGNEVSACTIQLRAAGSPGLCGVRSGGPRQQHVGTGWPWSWPVSFEFLRNRRSARFGLEERRNRKAPRESLQWLTLWSACAIILTSHPFNQTTCLALSFPAHCSSDSS